MLNICLRNYHGYVALVVITIRPFIIHHRLCDKSNTTGVTTGAGTTYTWSSSELSADVLCVPCCSSIVFCVVLCNYFLHLSFGHCSVSPITASDNSFCVFRLFFLYRLLLVFKEWKTIQLAKEKGQKDKQRSTNNYTEN